MKSPRDRARPDDSYVLGHSERELDRLTAQARLIDPITRRFLCSAGIVTGMRVLDVGSGIGDVAFLAADLVGATGEVVGTDRSAAALAVARRRADTRPLRNVVFREGDPAEMAFDRPFDAVIGRYVLMFQRDPAAMLRRLGGKRGSVLKSCIISQRRTQERRQLRFVYGGSAGGGACARGAAGVAQRRRQD